MNKEFKYKIGDKVRIINNLAFGSWANCIVVIEGFLIIGSNGDYNISRQSKNSIYRDYGQVKQEWLVPLTKEIKVFDDE